ncbi:MAG TPA: CehA/McbA family metallohydrolase [Thermoanaerobaculia bacterium]|nr:CehA/McbA family metallohydrolase [Thermoanaerobaculia bacterium]
MAQALIMAVLALALDGAPVSSPSRAVEAGGAPLQLFKGNLHTHTSQSDGDTPPDEVARWYREHGYDFLVITDHDKITLAAAVPGLLLIPGEEVTDRLPDRPLHVNAIGLTRLVPPQGGATVTEVLQRNVDAVRAAGGIALINHPNFNWAFGSDELKNVSGASLLEIASGHPLVNSEGGAGVASVESIWDDVLTSGRMIYAAGVDDSHDFKSRTDGGGARPGRAWVVVRAASATAETIVKALADGEFYASTGVKLSAWTRDPARYSVTIDANRNTKYRTQFVGSGGRVLWTTTANPAVYDIIGTEGYVRAMVIDSYGRKAWLQPVAVGPR